MALSSVRLLEAGSILESVTFLREGELNLSFGTVISKETCTSTSIAPYTERSRQCQIGNI